MAENEEGEENTSRGNEWEVVSLTASTYAAAPGPKEVELEDDDKGAVHGEDKAETSHALFMSGHFVFPPSKHENLPMELDSSEIHDESGGKDAVSEASIGEGLTSSGKGEENWPLKGLNVPDEFTGMQFSDEKVDGLSIHGKQFEEDTDLQALSLVDKEEDIYGSVKYSSFHSEPALDGTATFGEDTGISERVEPSEQSSNFSSDMSESRNLSEDDKCASSDLPCGAWWKRRATSLYTHAKEANAFWSIFIAAAVMGLVMLGQHWQQERWQALEHKWQISINNERRGRMLGPISRLKEVIVGGNRPGSLSRGSSASDS
ncbi:ATG8-interacting protein 1 [Quillaja saponaria]|uniref:ATG8-interacting protein 1 n=1 Tax=Quillaja saponaria TaxID=32244 RepID=A0AAD7L4B9_QUISA|nr:ATG8-interacting protein 1 [Quillaja saponaria]KAJ7951157.1 ATG8-interacting protein 1 [Quillaja saponaria]